MEIVEKRDMALKTHACLGFGKRKNSPVRWIVREYWVPGVDLRSVTVEAEFKVVDADD